MRGNAGFAAALVAAPFLFWGSADAGPARRHCKPKYHSSGYGAAPAPAVYGGGQQGGHPGGKAVNDYGSAPAPAAYGGKGGSDSYDSIPAPAAYGGQKDEVAAQQTYGWITPHPGAKPTPVTKQLQDVYTCTPQEVQCNGNEGEECHTVYKTQSYKWVSTVAPCYNGQCTITDYNQPVTVDGYQTYAQDTAYCRAEGWCYYGNGQKTYVAAPTSFPYTVPIQRYYVCPWSKYYDFHHNSIGGRGGSCPVDIHDCRSGICKIYPGRFWAQSDKEEYLEEYPINIDQYISRNGPFRYRPGGGNGGIDITININNAPTYLHTQVSGTRTRTRTVTRTRTSTIPGTTTTTTTTQTQSAAPDGGTFVLAADIVVNARRRLAKRQSSTTRNYVSVSNGSGKLVSSCGEASIFTRSNDGKLAANGIGNIVAPVADLQAGAGQFGIGDTSNGAVSSTFSFNGPYLNWQHPSFDTDNLALFCAHPSTKQMFVQYSNAVPCPAGSTPILLVRVELNAAECNGASTTNSNSNTGTNTGVTNTGGTNPGVTNTGGTNPGGTNPGGTQTQPTGGPGGTQTQPTGTGGNTGTGDGTSTNSNPTSSSLSTLDPDNDSTSGPGATSTSTGTGTGTFTGVTIDNPTFPPETDDSGNTSTQPTGTGTGTGAGTGTGTGTGTGIGSGTGTGTGTGTSTGSFTGVTIDNPTFPPETDDPDGTSTQPTATDGSGNTTGGNGGTTGGNGGTTGGNGGTTQPTGDNGSTTGGNGGTTQPTGSAGGTTDGSGNTTGGNGGTTQPTGGNGSTTGGNGSTTGGNGSTTGGNGSTTGGNGGTTQPTGGNGSTTGGNGSTTGGNGGTSTQPTGGSSTGPTSTGPTTQPTSGVQCVNLVDIQSIELCIANGGDPGGVGACLDLGNVADINLCINQCQPEDLISLDAIQNCIDAGGSSLLNNCNDLGNDPTLLGLCVELGGDNPCDTEQLLLLDTDDAGTRLALCALGGNVEVEVQTCIGLSGTALINCLITGGGNTGIGGLPTLSPSGTIGTLLSCQSQFPNPILAQICVNQNGGNPCNADALAQVALTDAPGAGTALQICTNLGPILGTPGGPTVDVTTCLSLSGLLLQQCLNGLGSGSATQTGPTSTPTGDICANLFPNNAQLAALCVTLGGNPCTSQQLLSLSVLEQANRLTLCVAGNQLLDLQTCLLNPLTLTQCIQAGGASPTTNTGTGSPTPNPLDCAALFPNNAQLAALCVSLGGNPCTSQQLLTLNALDQVNRLTNCIANNQLVDLQSCLLNPLTLTQCIQAGGVTPTTTTTNTGSPTADPNANCAALFPNNAQLAALCVSLGGNPCTVQQLLTLNAVDQAGRLTLCVANNQLLTLQSCLLQPLTLTQCIQAGGTGSTPTTTTSSTTTTTSNTGSPTTDPVTAQCAQDFPGSAPLEAACVTLNGADPCTNQQLLTLSSVDQATRLQLCVGQNRLVNLNTCLTDLANLAFCIQNGGQTVAQSCAAQINGVPALQTLCVAAGGVNPCSRSGLLGITNNAQLTTVFALCNTNSLLSGGSLTCIASAVLGATALRNCISNTTP